MALKVKSEKVRPKGKFLVFVFLFFSLLVIFALFFALLLLIGGYSLEREYYNLYIEFSPLTMILPFIIAITTVVAYKTSRMHISPANKVNVPKLKELFITKTGYRVIEERDNFIMFENAKAFPRIFWLNIDKPTIEIKGDEVLITLKKHTEAVITPLLVYGKHFDLDSES